MATLAKFADAEGQNLDTYRMIKSNGSAESIRLTWSPTLTVSGTPLDAAHLNPLIDQINSNTSGKADKTQVTKDIATSLASAKSYADQKDSAALTNAKNFATNEANRAFNNSKNYTDNKSSFVETATEFISYGDSKAYPKSGVRIKTDQYYLITQEHAKNPRHTVFTVYGFYGFFISGTSLTIKNGSNVVFNAGNSIFTEKGMLFRIHPLPRLFNGISSYHIEVFGAKNELVCMGTTTGVVIDAQNESSEDLEVIISERPYEA